MSLTTAQRIPLATYRLQLHKAFNFAAARELLAYLRMLGISDAYLSPILLSAPGSQHGYDVNDYRRIDPELGGKGEFERLSQDAAGRGMGLLVDFVPNHMGINGPFNTWWRAVLEGGRHSPYARFFDVDWNDSRSPDRPRVLLPVLEDHFGRVLEQGGLKIGFKDGAFELVYGDLRFPLSPGTYGRLLRLAAEGDGGEALAALADQFGGLPRPEAAAEPELAKERFRLVTELKRQLAALCQQQPESVRRIQAGLDKVNGSPGNPSSFDVLEHLIENQHYRLARWQAGAQGTNYRRFFAVDSMVGVRMENPEVFQESHALMKSLIGEGRVTGVRIDHIDGLWDPVEYLERLQAIRGDDAAAPPLYVVVEKILAPGEALPAAWPCHGTTGYDFIPQLARLFVDRRAEARFDAIYSEFTGIDEGFGDIVYSRKRQIIESLFAGTLTRLTQTLGQLLRRDRIWRDFTAHELALAVRETMANMSVYRTYRRDGQPMDPAGRRAMETACDQAIRRNPRLAPEPIQFVRDLLTGDFQTGAPEVQRQIEDWVMTFQQYTGAVTAKAVEDTGFYGYNRLVALNEVGCDPRDFGGDLEGFHAANQRRLETMPHSLLATSTHDTKWSEDVRARLYTLSEIPGDWGSWIREWRQLNQRHKTRVDGRLAPDANEEYRLYQILLGAWPLDDGIDGDFRERIRQHLRKSVSEEKENSTWHHPNEPWLEACDAFVAALLDEAASGEFLAHFRPRAGRIAHLGMINSISQLVLKITVPGVPDFYQGCESWDFSLVDPDNRRPVDYGTRQQIVSDIESGSAFRHFLRHWRTGAVKIHTMRRLLEFRAAHADLFQRGSYLPVEVAGQYRDQVVAFARVLGAETVLVVVPRLTARLGCPPLGLVWEDTRLIWNRDGGAFEDVMRPTAVAASGDIYLADAFSEMPFFVAKLLH